MVTLTERLDRYLALLVERGSLAGGELLPGLSDDEILDMLGDRRALVHPSIFELYRWRNGYDRAGRIGASARRRHRGRMAWEVASQLMGSSPLEGQPLLVRTAVVGLVAFGLVGGVVGLILGLIAHPPTAWFAVIEVGLPAAVLGGLGGLAVGAIASLGKHRASRPLP